MTAVVKEGDAAVDIGAHQGLYTLYLSSRVGGRGRDHAFEPNRDYWLRLGRIAAACPNVSVHRCALSDHPGHGTLRVPVVDGRAVGSLGTLGEWNDGNGVVEEVVILECLDDVIPADEPIHFLKCDVEGHELAVLRGVHRTVRRWRPTLLVEIEWRHGQLDVDEVIAQLEALGYSGYFLGAAGLERVSGFDLEHHQRAYIGALQEVMPKGYVSDFLFVATEQGTAHIQGLLAG